MTTTAADFPMEMFEAIAVARKADEEGVEDAYDLLFDEVFSEEELVRAVWVLHDTLRSLVVRMGYTGLDMLFRAQTSALLAMSMKFAEESFVAIYPEHIRWYEEELTVSDDEERGDA